jgi:predicted PurR-regulated permease PerM
MNTKSFVISSKTILLIFAVLALSWLLYSIFSVILYLFVALVIALGLEPFVEFFVKKRIPRSVSVLLVFLVFLLVLFSAVGFALVPMVSETQHLISRLPELIGSLKKYPQLAWVANSAGGFLVSNVSITSKSVLNITASAFSGFLSVVSVLIFTLYLLADFNNVREYVASLTPRKHRAVFVKTVSKIEQRLGAWIRGELVLMTVIGVFTFIGLTIIGMDYALPLALIAGILEIIPTIGPIISAIPAGVVAFSVSSTTGFLTLAVYILVQQLENNLFVPKIMQKAVGFNPLVTLLAVLIGGKLFGFMGMLFSIPVVLIMQTIVEAVAND